MFASTTTTCWPERASATARFAIVVEMPSSSEALVNMITFMPRLSVEDRFSLRIRNASAVGIWAPPCADISTTG